jgi:hypothetical protein
MFYQTALARRSKHLKYVAIRYDNTKEADGWRTAVTSVLLTTENF